MTASETMRTLRAIDWDFAMPRSGYVPPPHWYPGTFVPALSDALIESLAPPFGTVFDPYAGIGTTGWSATRSGRRFYVADLNPIALLVSYATNSLLLLAHHDQDRCNLALSSLERLSPTGTDLFGASRDPSDVRGIDETAAQVCGPSPTTILADIVAGPPNWNALERWIAAGAYDRS